jgi:hypothetical protein
MNRRAFVILVLGVAISTAVYIIGKRHQSVAAAMANPQPPERVATWNTLTSERDPKIALEIKPPVEYVGADRWVLYGVADCEIHVFVEADKDKKVSRLYWIQFEGYLPEIATAKYDGYDSPIRTKIGGREFIVDGFFYPTNAPYRRPDSDREHVMNLLKAKGYTLPAEMMTRRMVHLPNPDLRKELMIIYAEDLAPTGFTVADLKKGGKAEAEWPRLEKEMLQRATERISAK